MAEIILDADRSLEEQLRELLDLASEHGIGHSQVEWYPQSGDDGVHLPHGSVVKVPDELAEKHAARHAPEPEAEAKPKRGRARRAAGEKSETDGAGDGDGGEQTEE